MRVVQAVGRAYAKPWGSKEVGIRGTERKLEIKEVTGLQETRVGWSQTRQG